MNSLTIQQLGVLEEHNRAISTSSLTWASRLGETDGIVERQAESLVRWNRKLFSTANEPRTGTVGVPSSEHSLENLLVCNSSAKEKNTQHAALVAVCLPSGQATRLKLAAETVAARARRPTESLKTMVVA